MRYMLMLTGVGLSLRADLPPLGPDVMPRGYQTRAELKLFSDDFAHNGLIPAAFSCEGAIENHSPQIQWKWDGKMFQIVKEYVLICEDLDAPGQEPFVHWLVYNIPPSANGVITQLKRSPAIDDGTKQGTNSFGRIGYDGPCPPPGDKPHLYVFILHALEKPLSVPAGATKKQLFKAIDEQSHIIRTAQLMGTYQRKK